MTQLRSQSSLYSWMAAVKLSKISNGSINGYYKVETAYYEVASPVWNWIGNEIEIDWWYSFKALLVEIPVYSKRKLKS